MTAPAWHPRPGDCLLIDSGPTGKHLFIIVLEAIDGGQHQFISFPVCTVRDHARIDDACIVRPGEHSFIKSESFIEYRNARVDSVAHLTKCVKAKTFIPHDQASEELMEKIKAGISASKFIGRYIKDMIA